MTVRMTLNPKSLDTIVATNLHADILSDLAGALAGSLGVAPTANIDPQRRFPSMFEPIHGSAFDIVGKGIANPVATFWTAVQMLEHLGEPDAAARKLIQPHAPAQRLPLEARCRRVACAALAGRGRDRLFAALRHILGQ
jgi:isocitrate/isopropylmalate dehydrogenase